MTAHAQSSFLAEHDCLLGDALDWSSLSEAARGLLETRLQAAVFKRRWPLLIRWRQQSLARKHQSRRTNERANAPARPVRATAGGEITVFSNLPRQPPILGEEIAILRAFLSREIDAILIDEAP